MDSLDRFISKNIQIIFCITASILTFLFYLCFAVYVHRGFFYDGSNFYVGLLSKKFIWAVWNDPQHMRLFANYFNQFPISLAIFTGVTDLPLLRFLFNFGLFFIPLLIYGFWILLSLRAKKYNVFLAALASTAICVIPSEIFILNQSITTVALCWVILHYLLLDININKYDLIVIFCISFILFRAHEAMILCGPVMSFAAVCMLLRNKKSFFTPLKKIVLYLYSFLGIILFINAFWWQSTHPTDAATTAFLQIALYQLHPSRLFSGNTLISILGLICILISLFFIFEKRNRLSAIARSSFYLSKKILVCIFLILLIYSFLPYFYPQIIDPVKEMHIRFLIPFGSVIFMIFAVPFSFINLEKYPKAFISLTFSIFICLAAASIWQTANSFYWNQYYKITENYIEQTEIVLIPPENMRHALFIHPALDLNKFSLGWGWTVLGISMLNEPEVKKLIKPEGFQDWFKLFNNNGLPLIPFIQFEEGGIFKFDNYLFKLSKEMPSQSLF